VHSPARASLSGAILAYAAGFSLTVVTSEGLVYWVARVKAGEDGSNLRALERGFALSAEGLMSCAFLEGLVLLAVALTAARLETHAVGTRLRLGRSRASGLGSAACALGLVGLTFACGGASQLAGFQGGSVMDAFAQALRAESPARIALGLVTIGLAPAVGEEAMFRGFLQVRLAERLGPWPAIVVTSAGFGLLHRDALQGTVAFAAGIFLGWTAERLGGLRPAILAHAVNNATFVALASAGAASTSTAGAQAASLALGGAACAAAVVVLRRDESLVAAP
jgi:membrane protease YdiL (CAAX protease family)